MKQNKARVRLIALALCAALVLALAGCSGASMTTADKLSAAMENMQKLNSYEYTMDMSMSLSMLGSELNMTTETKCTAFADPLKLKIVAEATTDGTTTETEMYIVQEGDNYVLYGKSGDEWESETLSAEEYEAQSGQFDQSESMELYLKNVENFEEQGYEDVNGTSALKIAGAISGESLQELLKDSGLLDETLSSMDEEDAADSAELTDKIIEAVGDLPVIIWIDEKNLLPVKYEIDMTDLLKSLYDVLFEQMGVDASLLEFEAGETVMTLTCTSFDSAEEFEVPAETME